MPAGYFPPTVLVAADSRTLFWSQLSPTYMNTWYRGRIDAPGSGAPFVPTGAQAPQGLLISRDGSTPVSITNGSLYVLRGPQFSDAVPLTTNTGFAHLGQLAYAPDTNSLAIKGGNTNNRVLMLNPKAPGWQEDLGPESGVSGVHCMAYAGTFCQ
jgi:hypothetical protein